MLSFVITRPVFSKISAMISPQFARKGEMWRMFVRGKHDICSALDVVAVYAMSFCICPWYDEIQLYSEGIISQEQLSSVRYDIS